ncbi:unnamed protein product, partial [Prorocentrum cordatum]
MLTRWRLARKTIAPSSCSTLASTSSNVTRGAGKESGVGATGAVQRRVGPRDHGLRRPPRGGGPVGGGRAHAAARDATAGSVQPAPGGGQVRVRQQGAAPRRRALRTDQAGRVLGA